MADRRISNLQKMKNEITGQKKPIIFYDVETTGIMNGNDNHVTQIALTAYNWNQFKGQYELQDNLFMLAKAHPDTLHNIEERTAPTKENAKRLIKTEYLYAYRKEVYSGITNCENRMETLEKRISHVKEQIAECTPRQIKKKEGYENSKAYYEKKLEEEKSLKSRLEGLRKYVEFDDPESMTFQEINDSIEALKKDKTYIADRNTVITSEVFSGIVQMRNLNHVPDKDRLTICNTLYDYEIAKLDSKIESLKNENLEALLSHQGINKDKWIKDGLGLTEGELQTGIQEFLNKYRKADTVCRYGREVE